MYKMIAIDLDGTLLSDQLTVSKETIGAIRSATEQGTVVTIATGRMFPSAQLIAREIGIDVPLITYQGAIIKSAGDEKVLYERLVPEDISKKLIDIASERNLYIQVYQNDVLYSSTEDEKLKHYAQEVNVSYQVEPDLKVLAEKGFTKLLFIDEVDVLDELERELNDIFGDTAYIKKSKKNYLEVTHPEANKGSALLFLAEKLGIDRSETIGIGDNHNDYDLLKSAGLGVAMGNAVQELKDIADYTSLTNNEDGVLHVLNKFVLEPASATAARRDSSK